MALTGIEGVVSGNVAGVDANNRLLTLATPDSNSRTVYTTMYTSVNAGNTPIAARSGRCAFILQNQAGVPITLRLDGTGAGANDLQIAPGATFTSPFPYAGAAGIYGIGGGGNAVLIEATE
jgi:hypothetical protein